jgi:hypothetical protein
MQNGNTPVSVEVAVGLQLLPFQMCHSEICAIWDGEPEEQRAGCTKFIIASKQEQLTVVRKEVMLPPDRGFAAFTRYLRPCLLLLVIHPKVVHAKVAAPTVQEKHVSMANAEGRGLSRRRLPNQ